MAVASNSPLAKAIQGTPMGFNPGGLVKSRGPLPIPGLADEGPGTPAWEQLHAKELAGDAIAAANAGHVRTFPGNLENGTPAFAPAAKSNNYGASSAGDKAIAAAQKDLAANEAALKKSQMGRTPGR